MIYWVEQIKGSQIDSVRKVRQHLSEGAIDELEAWTRYVKLYKSVSNSEPPSYTHSAGHGASIDYMLKIWFPRYANVFYSGSKRKCQQYVDENTTKDEQYTIYSDY